VLFPCPIYRSCLFQKYPSEKRKKERRRRGCAYFSCNYICTSKINAAVTHNDDDEEQEEEQEEEEAEELSSFVLGILSICLPICPRLTSEQQSMHEKREYSSRAKDDSVASVIVVVVVVIVAVYILTMSNKNQLAS
jgi:H+/gluconate symporter-like permease